MIGRCKVLDIAAVIITTLLVSACATHFGVTVDSSPKGAKVWQDGGEYYYIAPTHWSFAPDKQIVDPKTGCKIVRGFHAQWQSGATASSPSPLNLCGDWSGWTVTMERPSNYPNMGIDLAVEQAFVVMQQQAFAEQQLEQEDIAANWSGVAEILGYAIGCKVAGGCRSTSATSPSYSTKRSYDSSTSSSSYVGGGPQLALDGTYVGGSPQLAPDGSYVGGSPQLAPDGSYVGGGY